MRRPARRDRRSAEGFTLVELMVTVAVLAVLAALAAPAFNEFFEKGRLRAAVDETQSLLASARQEAVKANREVVFSIGGTTTAWCAGANMADDPATLGINPLPAAAACDCTSPAECEVSGQQLAMDSTAFRDVSISAVGASVRIDPLQGTVDGIPPRPVTFSSGTGNYQLRLVITQLGQSRACVPTGVRPFTGFPSC